MYIYVYISAKTLRVLNSHRSKMDVIYMQLYAIYAIYALW